MDWDAMHGVFLSQGKWPITFFCSCIKGRRLKLLEAFIVEQLQVIVLVYNKAYGVLM
jgi:hypothetical protein